MPEHRICQVVDRLLQHGLGAPSSPARPSGAPAAALADAPESEKPAPRAGQPGSRAAGQPGSRAAGEKEEGRRKKEEGRLRRRRLFGVRGFSGGLAVGAGARAFCKSTREVRPFNAPGATNRGPYALTGIRRADPHATPSRKRRTPPHPPLLWPPYEGAQVLDEVGGELGLLLFQRVRDVALWSGSSIPERDGLFAFSGSAPSLQAVRKSSGDYSGGEVAAELALLDEMVNRLMRLILSASLRRALASSIGLRIECSMQLPHSLPVRRLWSVHGTRCLRSTRRVRREHKLHMSALRSGSKSRFPLHGDLASEPR